MQLPPSKDTERRRNPSYESMLKFLRLLDNPKNAMDWNRNVRAITAIVERHHAMESQCRTESTDVVCALCGGRYGHAMWQARQQALQEE